MSPSAPATPLSPADLVDSPESIEALNRRSNQVTAWAAMEVVTLSTAKSRRKAIEKLLGVAKVGPAQPIRRCARARILPRLTRAPRAGGLLGGRAGGRQFCRDMNDYCDAFAIVNGLLSPAVHRLRKSWEGLPSRERAIQDMFQKLMDPSSNMRIYREAYEKVNKPPCIPFFRT